MTASMRLAVLCLCMPIASTLCLAQKIALRGTVITPSGPVANATVLIEGTEITAVGSDVKIPSGVKTIETHGTIYPGLIDLHNHVTWNVLPRWSAGTKSGARYDWQQLPEYQMALDVPHRKMVAEGHGCAAERYAEVKALVGGATSQAGLNPPDLTETGTSTASIPPPATCLAGLTRELGVRSRFSPTGTQESLHYEVFPLGLDPATTTALLDGLHTGTIKAALLHIAEGSAENASARREFAMLRARGLLLPGVSIIHGVALSPANFAEMAKAGVGLIWSPRSNFELYGSTSAVAEAKKAGVTIAIAPDWSPTGSDGMLQELKYAAVWNATQNPEPFTDRELFEMATHHAAQLAGIAGETGTIASGMKADLLVLSGTAKDPYVSLLQAPVSDVDLVMVDGVPVYGAPGLMKQAGGGASNSMIDVCGTAKAIALDPDRWASTTAELIAELNAWGARLSPLADCR